MTYRQAIQFVLLISLSSLSLSALSKSTASLPTNISPPGEKLILVNPRINAWGAYSSSGHLIRSGVASTGKSWCSDIQRSCRTDTGTFRIYYMGDSGCYSTRFPIPTGGAPMPYCMYFNGNQALHGSYEVASAHLSHGCVRLHVGDAKWLRYQFVDGPNWDNNYRGTLVKILSY